MTGPLPPGWPGYLIGALTVVITLVISWRKGKIDESALILGRWKDMVDQHAEDIKDLREELRKERDQNATLREQLRSALTEADELRERLRKAEDKINGLERKIIQLGRSALNNIVPPDPGAEPSDSEAMKALGRLDAMANDRSGPTHKAKRKDPK